LCFRERGAPRFVAGERGHQAVECPGGIRSVSGRAQHAGREQGQEGAEEWARCSHGVCVVWWSAGV
ncbi:hypothetical protein NLR10_25395, partial [Escherichia coli]|nr:hypothetical protein [Escherichia coli]